MADGKQKSSEKSQELSKGKSKEKRRGIAVKSTSGRNRKVQRKSRPNESISGASLHFQVAARMERKSTYEVMLPGCRKKTCIALSGSKTDCAVPSCSTKTSEYKEYLTFVTMPKDPVRFRDWATLMGRSDILKLAGTKEGEDVVLCSQHFRPEMWGKSKSGQAKLLKSAVPSVFPDDVKKEPHDDDGMVTSDTLPETGATSTPIINSEVSAKNSGSGSLRPKRSAKRPKLWSGSDSEEASDILQGTNSDYSHSENESFSVPLKKRKQISQRKILVIEDSSDIPDTTQPAIPYKIQMEYRKLQKDIESLKTEIKNYIPEDSCDEKEFENYRSLLQRLEDEQKRFEAHRKLNEELLNSCAKLKEKVKQLKSEVKITDELVHYQRQSMRLKFREQSQFYQRAIRNHLLKHEYLKTKVMKLDRYVNTSCEGANPSQLVRYASKYLTGPQLALFESQLSKKAIITKKFVTRFKEFATALFQASPTTYKICQKFFALPGFGTVHRWANESRDTTNSFSDVMVEKLKPLTDAVVAFDKWADESQHKLETQQTILQSDDSLKKVVKGDVTDQDKQSCSNISGEYGEETDMPSDSEHTACASYEECYRSDGEDGQESFGDDESEESFDDSESDENEGAEFSFCEYEQSDNSDSSESEM